MFGIEINFNDGKKDWIDPVFDEPVEKDGVLIVSNSSYSYGYSLADVNKWFKYDLCKKCNSDVRRYGCGDSGCFDPKNL